MAEETSTTDTNRGAGSEPAVAPITMGEVQDDNEDWKVNPEHLKNLQRRFANEDFPLFMEKIPDNIEGNPHLEALQQLLYAEQTPEERAQSFREQGNDQFRDALKSDTSMENRTKRLHDAVSCYTQGLEQKCSDARLNALLYANRGHAYLLLKQFTDCVDNCREALKCDPSHVKSCYRAAKASFYMQLFTQCCAFCDQGLRIEPENAVLQQLRSESQAQLDRLQDSRRQVSEKSDTMNGAIPQEKQEILLETAFKHRGLRVTKNCGYDASHLQGNGPFLDNEGCIHWPCLLLYPEYSISEIILDVHEDTTIMDHLQAMFPGAIEGKEFAAWDAKRTYRCNALSVFYEPGLPDGGLFRISVDRPLREILSAAGYVAYVPIFHIVVKGSYGEQAFLAENVVRPLTLETKKL